MNETMRGMRQHVSVRQFRDEIVDSALLTQILECGQAASSSSFIQAYSVIRVSDRDNRQRIARAAGDQAWVLTAPEFLVFCADLNRIEHCCVRQAQGVLDGYTEHFIAATVDVALMAQNVLLAAESAGLGGVFIGGIRNDPRTVSECLQLPRLVYPVFGMCLGWPAEKNPTKPRMPLADILHQDRYAGDNPDEQIDHYDQRMADYYAARGSNSRASTWSRQTASAIQGKKRAHMLEVLQARGFVLR
jgi:nitroreductase